MLKHHQLGANHAELMLASADQLFHMDLYVNMTDLHNHDHIHIQDGAQFWLEMMLHHHNPALVLRQIDHWG
jgi:hypothetical protein